MIVLSSPLVFRWRSQIVKLALQRRLPTMISVFTSFPKVGGLLAYGPNLPAMFMRAVSYYRPHSVGSKTQRPAFERPSKFRLSRMRRPPLLQASPFRSRCSRAPTRSFNRQASQLNFRFPPY